MNATDEERLHQRIQALNAERETLVDALDHIMRTCAGSRTQTRRLRWIAVRCQSAIEGNDAWKTTDVPVMDPLLESLRELLGDVYPFCKRELGGLLDSYNELDRDVDSTNEEVLESITDEGVRADCRLLIDWIAAVRRAVPKINNEERRNEHADAAAAG